MLVSKGDCKGRKKDWKECSSTCFMRYGLLPIAPKARSLEAASVTQTSTVLLSLPSTGQHCFCDDQQGACWEAELMTQAHHSTHDCIRSRHENTMKVRNNTIAHHVLCLSWTSCCSLLGRDFEHKLRNRRNCHADLN
eukprot:1102764-Amphidinium_carterae.1